MEAVIPFFDAAKLSYFFFCRLSVVDRQYIFMSSLSKIELDEETILGCH